MGWQRRGFALLGMFALAGTVAGCEPAPSPWSSELVSMDASGNAAGATADYDVSPDGTRVVFTTTSSGLGPNDTNGLSDVYVRDLDTGVNTLVSVNAAGSDGGNGASTQPSFGPDGTTVVFTSKATDLGPADTRFWSDVYLRDLDGQVTSLVSVNAAGTDSSNGDSERGVISPDGSKVAFTSRGNDFGPADTAVCWYLQGPYVDDWPCRDIYVRDLAAGVTTLVSAAPPGIGFDDTVPTDSGNAVFSPDGSQIAYDTNGLQIIPGTQPDVPFELVLVRDLAQPFPAVVPILADGTWNQAAGPEFSPDGSQLAFHGTTGLGLDVYVRDLAAGVTSRVSVGETEVGRESRDAVFSPDGTKIAFVSSDHDFGPTDTNGVSDVYVRDLSAGVTTLVSTNTSGDDAGNQWSGYPVFSPDGTKVAFTSLASDLGPTDSFECSSRSCLDVYVRDLVTGTTSVVSSSAAGADSGNQHSTLPVFASDTQMMFHSAASNLGPVDDNSAGDLYLATLHGADLGLSMSAEPSPVASGGRLIYGFQVTSDGPDRADVASLTVVLPAEVTFVEATSSVGACTPPAADEPRAVVCDLGDLHVGDSVDVSVAVQAEAPAGATLTAVAQTASTVTDPDTTDNLVALDTEVVPAG